MARLTEYVHEHGGRLLLVLRSDFYGHLAAVDALAPYAEKAAVVVGPMRADELRRALVEPASAAGLRLEPELVETIMEDIAGQPDPLPLLSEAMVRTWRRRSGDLLTLEGYRRTGGVAGALEAAAEECYAGLTDGARQTARHLLVRMAARSANGWVRRPILRTGFAASGAERETLEAFVAARLVVVSDERVEITHDALLGHWPRLRDWLGERALAAEMLDHLDRAATVWLTSGRQAGDLYRGPRLNSALDWRAEHPDDLSPDEDEFLGASARAADAELVTARAQVVRERRGRRRLKSVAIVLAAVVVLAAATTVVAWRERSTARTAASQARQASLAADAHRLAALSVDAPDIATSSLLAVMAYRLQDSADTRGALLGAVERNESALWRIQTQHRLQRVIATPDGSELATIDNRRNVEVFDVATRKQIAQYQANGYEIEGTTPDGHHLVVFGPANNEGNSIGRLSILDIVTGKRVRVVTTAGDRSGTEPAMTSDARWLAMVTSRHRAGGIVVAVFDVTNWTAPPREFVETGAPVVLGAGRSAFAIERSDGSVDVRALPSLRPIGRLNPIPGSDQQPGGPGTLAVSPDGSHVARIDPDDQRSVAVYGIGAAHVAPVPLPTQEQNVSQVAFSPDGAEIAVGTLAGSVMVYRTVDGTQTDALVGHTGAVSGVTWTGRTTPTGLYSVGLDSQLTSWTLNALPRTMTESGPDIAAPDRGEVFGHFVLGLTPAQGNAPESQEHAYLVNIDNGRRSFWPLGLKDGDYVNQAVASSDGQRGLISVETQKGLNRIEIWDLTRQVLVGRLALPGTAQFPIGLNAAISADGRTAYSSLGATQIGVFDLPSGQYVRNFTVRFAQPNSARIYAIPWMFDPNGRLLVGGFDPNATTGVPPRHLAPSMRDHQTNASDCWTSTRHALVAQTSLGDVNFPTAIAWSHDRTRLAVGAYEGTLALYDAETLALQASAGVVEPGWVKTASFAPDDRTLVTGGTFGAIKFYNVPDLTPIASPLQIGNSSNNGGVFAWYQPNGQVQGYAADAAKPTFTFTQRWFELHTDRTSLVSTACDLAGADITPAQWKRYVGDRPYRHICP